ncbi:1-aminocyclopropane-1-carboxylate deaminase [Bienertia sinuspersici]
METLASPPTCIIHNLPIQYDEQDKPIVKSFVMIRDMLRDLGYKVKKFRPAWNHHGFKEYGFIKFGLEDEDLKQAVKLGRKFHQCLANREAEADILDAFGTIKIWLDNMINDE